ncbi:MAG: hypothetical protein P0Y60_17895 [Candidatus Microbacterium colombiense]|nr:MAG: hypothetical protein P0Y60_17895 [Microbacterium sp.]
MTDGGSLVNERRVSEWVARSVATLDSATRLFVADHLDEILGETPEAGFDANASLELLSACARRLPAGMDARLAVPWGDSVALDMELPPLDALPILEPYEPPSLYVFAREYWAIPNDREEYRCPYDGSPWGDEYGVEYSCGRSPRERTLGWEFTRTVWVHARAMP